MSFLKRHETVNKTFFSTMSIVKQYFIYFLNFKFIFIYDMRKNVKKNNSQKLRYRKHYKYLSLLSSLNTLISKTKYKKNYNFAYLFFILVKYSECIYL